MTKLSADEITKLLDKHQAGGGNANLQNVPFEKITCLPARVENGSIFFCVPGETRDSSTPFEDALKNGAACIFSEADQKNFAEPSNINVPHVRVRDAREAFAEFSASLFGKPSEKLRVIGVTGTNGKTTITHLIEHIFNHANKRIGLIGTLGYRLPEKEICNFGHTTPPAGELQEVLAKMRDADCSHVSLEVTSHGLVFRRVGSCDFSAAILSNITPDHLDFHGTMEHYWQTKRRLFEALNESQHENKCAIINIDEALAEHFLDVCGNSIKRITYGFSKSADIRVIDHEWKDGRNHVRISANGQQFDLSMRIPGRFNLYNAMAAIACCLHEGITLDQIVEAIEEFEGVPGRFERVSTGAETEPLCIVDFAHTPDGLEKVLTTIRDVRGAESQTQAKIVCVFGCQGERDASKRPMMGEIAERLADRVIITNSGPGNEDAERIAENIKSGMKESQKAHVELDRFQAIKDAISAAGPNDAILIAGQGCEQFQQIGDKEVAIDDRIEARKALKDWLKIHAQ